MTRRHVSFFVLLLVITATFFDAPTNKIYASGPSWDCSQQPIAVANDVYAAADTYMTGRYPTIYGGAAVQRVVGDWALVVVTPKVPADRAALVLHYADATGWSVVAGPGTAFPPEARPAGLPPELLDTPARCG